MGSFFNIGPDHEQTANDWANQHVIANFQGTLADLYALITQQSNECSSYVRRNTILASTNNTLAVCKEVLQARYQPQLDKLQGEDKGLQDAIRNGILDYQIFGSNKNIVALIIIVFVVLVIMVLILF